MADSATPSPLKEANVGPSTALDAGAAGGGDVRSPSQRVLAIADGKSGAEDETNVAPPNTACEMRAKLKAARDGLAADRAAAAPKAARGPAKASGAGNKTTKAKKKIGQKHNWQDKPKSWLKVRPNGCAKCRYIPGCTKSCYTNRGEAVPK